MKSGKKLVIIGLGETARLAYEYFTVDSKYDVVAFSVEPQYIDKEIFCNLPVIKLSEIKNIFPPEKYDAFIAISSTDMNRARERMFSIMKSYGYKMANYVSSHALVWHDVVMGENCCIIGKSILESGVKLGNNIIVWNALVAHSSTVFDHAFLAVNSTICGWTNIKNNCFIGANSVIGDGLKGSTTIGSFNFIAANSVVAGITKENSRHKGYVGFIK